VPPSNDTSHHWTIGLNSSNHHTLKLVHKQRSLFRDF